MTASFSENRPVAVIGLGTIGASWAVLFCAGGEQVRVYDSSAGARQRAGTFVHERLTQVMQDGTKAAEAAARLTVVSRLEDAVSGAAYVQESISEDVRAKRVLFNALAEIATSDAILASSASELPGSRFMMDIVSPERALVVHPMNPPYLMPLVELSPTEWTSQVTLEKTRDFMIRLGRVPVVLRKELAGFIANRLQMALVGEAMRLVGEGYCSGTEADLVVRHGLGPRWALLGPFEAAHLNAAGGLREYFTKFREPIRKLMSAANPDYEYGADLIAQLHDEVESRYRGETVAELQAWRDSRLLALCEHLASCKA